MIYYCARQCSITNEGMDEGWYCENTGQYFKYEKDARKHVGSMGYNTIDDAVDDGSFYWTIWDGGDYEYVEIDGTLYEIDKLDPLTKSLLERTLSMESILDDIASDLADYQNESGIGTMDDGQWADLFIERVAASITSYETKTKNNENN